MTTNTKLVEERIREHYTAQNGEWLVEKGKVKEAKLLKEACLTIEKLRASHSKLQEEKRSKHWENYDLQKELDRREKELAQREARLQNRLDSLAEDIARWTKQIPIA